MRRDSIKMGAVTSAILILAGCIVPHDCEPWRAEAYAVFDVVEDASRMRAALLASDLSTNDSSYPFHFRFGNTWPSNASAYEGTIRSDDPRTMLLLETSGSGPKNGRIFEAEASDVLNSTIQALRSEGVFIAPPSRTNVLAQVFCQ